MGTTAGRRARTHRRDRPLGHGRVVVPHFMIITSFPEPDGAAMNSNDRTTDPLPISRRTVIINTGLAAAIAGLSSCSNTATAPQS
jgi:hypothetical protein